MKIKSALVFGLLFFSALSTPAQDYPYEDKLDADERERVLPIETPEDTSASIKRRKTRHTWALKGGANFTVIQSESTVNPRNTLTEKGIGWEGLVAWGMDLSYQPVYFEVETGFRAQLISSDEKIYVVPMRFGFFYRERLGDRSVWRPGFVGGPYLRMIKNSENKYAKAMVPTFGFSSMWEYDHLLLEIVFHLHRLEKQYNFFDGSLRIGYRFW